MKIISLQAENIKKLVAVEIKPDGNMVEITGKNGHGKTSVLDSIWWALAGSSNVQSVPIRKGETKARIRLDMGELVVTRTFKSGKENEVTSSISVENADGARFPSPQSVLDKLIGELSFDPLGFARMSPKDQFDTLRKFVPDVDFEEIENHNKVDYTHRKEYNRMVKENETMAEAIQINQSLIDSGPPESGEDLLREFEDAAEKNREIQEQVQEKDSARDRIARGHSRTHEALAQIEQLQNRVKLLSEERKEEEKILEGKIKDPIDLSEIRKKIDHAKTVELELSKKESRDSCIKEAEQFEESSKNMTERMFQRDKKKRETIATAKLPIPEITFGENMILMNGVPFDQASDAEQLRASLAIAMSLNPKLRVIRVRDGSLLDPDSMAIVAKMASDKDFQVWIERVDGSGKVGFVLEDGMLKTKIGRKS